MKSVGSGLMLFVMVSLRAANLWAGADGAFEAVFQHPSDKPAPKAGDVILSFQPANLNLEAGQNATVTATITPADAAVTFVVHDATIAALTSVNRNEGTATLTLRGEKADSTFLSAQSAGKIVFGALPVQCGAAWHGRPLVLAARAPAAAAEEQLFTVSKFLTMTLMPGAPGDFLHGDLVAFKAPVDSGVPIPPFLSSLVWVGGLWADGYAPGTKSGYIATNGGMSCGPDAELDGPGTVTENFSGGGGEGVWFFAAFVHVRISNGGSWFWNSPFAVLTATQRISIASNGGPRYLHPVRPSRRAIMLC